MMEITVKRAQEKLNFCCPYKLYVNDLIVAKLKAGEEQIIEVNEDDIVTAKIDWVGSRKIKINHNSGLSEIIMKGNSYINRISAMGSVIPILAIMFVIISKNDWIKNLGYGLILVFLLYLILIYTVGKNRWILIDSINK